MKSLTIFAAIVGVLTVSGFVAPAFAQGQCPELSKVEWWTNTVPEVRRVVVAGYKGNWDAYIDRWKQQRKDLQAAYEGGSAVEIKSRALIFRNDDLKDYIAQVDERIKTLECLKRQYANAEPEPTVPSDAPQQAVPQELPPPKKVAAIAGQELSVEVSALCEGKTAAFQITNLGDLWPRLAEVSIFRTDTNGKIIQRRLRMANSQQMIFKVPNSASDAGEVGIFVEPSWYDRDFKYDATIKCQ